MSAIKEFYGGTFLNTQETINSSEKIELKYYKIINEVAGKRTNHIKYGIEVVKKCIKGNIITEEKKEIFNCIENEDTAEKVLEILKVNKVSPINVVDILEDMSYKKRRIKI